MERKVTISGHGNVQALRTLWSAKSHEDEQTKQQKSSTPRPLTERQEKQIPKTNTSTLKLNNEKPTTPILDEISPKQSIDKETPTLQHVNKLDSIGKNTKLSISEHKAEIDLCDEIKSDTINEKSTSETNSTRDIVSNISFKNPKQTSSRKWKITSLVVRSGLAVNRIRRSSDTIIPLLMKTHLYRQRPRSNSGDSTNSEVLFENVLDYVSKNTENDADVLLKPRKLRRSASDAKACMHRNQLDESILQYETIIRHLKNYDQFVSMHPVPASDSTVPSPKRQISIDVQSNKSTINEVKESNVIKKISPKRQVQSLSRNAGRTFAEFMMNDLLLSTPTTVNRPRSISHASSQTDISEPIQPTNNDQTTDITESIDTSVKVEYPMLVNEEVKSVLNEFDTIIGNTPQETPITPNSDIKVVVLNSPVTEREESVAPAPQPLMKVLFEEKKTAYSPDDLNMQQMRLPVEMLPAFETAKEKYFFDSEKIVYAAKAIKLRRRGYTQHVRIICITTERLYNVTRMKGYPKEAVFLHHIIGVTCTPYKDGFVCIHTKDVYEDRGDWLVFVDHPCEFVTQLFMALGRDNNSDDFFKIKTEFTHCRRFIGESVSTDCHIKAVKADFFRIKKTEFDCITIFSP